MSPAQSTGMPAPNVVSAAPAAVGGRAGLAPHEVAERRARFGPNVLRERRRRGPLRMLAAQFADVMVLVLLAAAAVAAIVGEPEDIVAIVVIVVLDAVLGFVQEYRAERAVLVLRRMAAPAARVRRAGTTLVVPAAELVPDDVVLLEAGNVVPADVRVVEAVRLRVDESALTGESIPVDKIGGESDAFLGTTVTHGRGVGIVAATGMHTALGRIARLLHVDAETRTPLQQRLARAGRTIAAAAVAICVIVFVEGIIRGERPALMLMTALSLAVAAIPEALPAVVTVSLALGARRLARERALVRRLPAVETLGSVTCICADKTGTLTENRMHVEAAWAGVDADAEEMLRAMALCNDVMVDADGRSTGDPTEVALYEAAARRGVAKRDVEAALPRVAEVPFASERATMTTVHHASDGAYVAYTKGAPERVLALCSDRPAIRAAALARVDVMAAEGLRVLALATRRLTTLPADLDAVEADETFLGLVGLLDPPREGARDAIALCRTAGIRVVMITGDHLATARAIAGRLGIDAADVHARVTPEEKLRIVEALQARGEIVAMTGDGVNDAPALRRADIGVAMGRGGTDVAREAAPMVLLDDDFSTIVAAVRDGRRIYDDIRKFVRYILTGNSAELWLLLLAPLVGLPLPLSPLQILWVNLVTDGLPGIALTAEPPESDVMRRPPRPPNESLFARGLWQHALGVGLLMGAATLAVQGWAFRTGVAHWRSMTFTAITLAQMGHVLAIRSERASLFRRGFLSNRPLLAAVALTCAAQLATLYVPALRATFGTAPLTAGELLTCLVAPAVVVAAVELEKWRARRRSAHAPASGA